MCNDSRPRIVVVGAGAAGIGCATSLHQTGKFEVLLVEARDRTGGRTHTLDCTISSDNDDCSRDANASRKKYYIDLGATWVEGYGRNEQGQLNPVVDLIQRFRHDMEPPKSNQRSDYLHLKEAQSSSVKESFDDGTAEKLAEKRLSTLLHQANEIVCELPETEDITVEEGFARARQRMGWDANDPIESHPSFLFKVSFLEQYHGGRLSDMSLRNYEFGESYGGPELWVYEGYGNLFQKLLEADFPKDQVYLSHVVQGIDYSNAKSRRPGLSGEDLPVVLTVFDQSRRTSKQIPCHAVVVCLPIGVLKSNKVTFQPPLPLRKLKAMGLIGSALMGKIVIRFERPFWESSNDSFLSGFSLLSRTRGKFRQWFIPYPNIPLLMCINPPDYAKVTESMRDEELFKEVLLTLAGAFGKALEELPKVVLFRRTTWGRDPFSLGTWSYLRRGGDSRNAMGILAEPLALPTENSKKSRVYFAGECTNVDDFSTAHGAYISGLRAAGEVHSDH